jgi:hypothetical protein
MKRWLILFFSLLVNCAYAMPNPASVYCLHHGGELKIMQGATGGAIGVCVFHNKSYCEEWSYTRGICKPSEYYLPEKKIGTKYCFAQLVNKNLIIYLCKAK